jgi:hypothetical protein
MEAFVSGDVAAMEKAYADIPEVANANRRIVGDIVEVGPKGSPTISGPQLSPAEARQILTDRGAPPKVITGLENNHGVAGLSDVAKMIESNPKAQYVDAGIEGAFFEWSHGKASVFNTVRA